MALKIFDSIAQPGIQIICSRVFIKDFVFRKLYIPMCMHSICYIETTKIAGIPKRPEW